MVQVTVLRKVQCHGRTYNEQNPAPQIKEITTKLSTLPKGDWQKLNCSVLVYKNAARINLKA